MKKFHKKEKKTIEYPDAPSGCVTLYHYKEPFMPFKGGFGYEGVLLFDAENDTIQCHLCGGFFEALPSHIFREHGMRASEYKEIVGLLQTSALISESTREKLVAKRKGRKARYRNLRPGGPLPLETREKIRATLLKNAQKRENQNRRGTCPLQLIERLRSRYDELGRTPTTNELGAGFVETIHKVHGSLKHACDLAGIPYRSPSQTLSSSNRPSEFKKPTYSEQELIELLHTFYKIHNRKPSLSDIRRGLLPAESRFRDQFGTWGNTLSVVFDK